MRITDQLVVAIVSKKGVGTRSACDGVVEGVARAGEITAQKRAFCIGIDQIIDIARFRGVERIAGEGCPNRIGARTRAADNGVIRLRDHKSIIATAADHRIGIRCICRYSTVAREINGTINDQIIAAAAGDRVIALATNERIVTAIALDGVIAAISIDIVILCATRDAIIICRSSSSKSIASEID